LECLSPQVKTRREAALQHPHFPKLEPPPTARLRTMPTREMLFLPSNMPETSHPFGWLVFPRPRTTPFPTSFRPLHTPGGGTSHPLLRVGTRVVISWYPPPPWIDRRRNRVFLQLIFSVANTTSSAYRFLLFRLKRICRPTGDLSLVPLRRGFSLPSVGSSVELL